MLFRIIKKNKIMPKTPKWMADAFEALFSGSYHPVQVTYTEMLTKTFKKYDLKEICLKLKTFFRRKYH